MESEKEECSKNAEQAAALLEEAKEAEKEALCRMIDAQLLCCRGKDGLFTYLELLIRFPEFSTENLLLLAKQAPKAVQIGTAEDWFLSGNPVRKGGRAFRIVNDAGEPQRWYDLSQTCDVPRKIGAVGILPVSELRKGSLFYACQKMSAIRNLNGNKQKAEEALKTISACIMCNAPFRFELVRASPWETMCTVYHPVDWQPARNTLRILKGIDGQELIRSVALVRALRLAGESAGEEITWLTASLAVYVLCRRIGLKLPVPEELTVLPPALLEMEREGIFCFLTDIRQRAEELQKILYENLKLYEKRKGGEKPCTETGISG